MLAPTASARIRYLDAAAKSTAPAASVVSSMLRVECNTLASGLRLPDPGRTLTSVCITCGGILSLVCSRTRRRVSLNPRQRTARRHKSSNKLSQHTHDTAQSTAKSAPCIARVCARCHRTASLPNALSGEISTSNQEQPTASANLGRLYEPTRLSILPNTPNSHLSEVARTPKPNVAVNAGSRKRAKARKHGGLQAILAKSRLPSDEASRMDLMDFMKSV